MTRNDFETYLLAKRRTWRLAQAIQMDKPTAQLIMELRYIHCLTIREIAGETGYSASGVRNIINRALKKVTST